MRSTRFYLQVQLVIVADQSVVGSRRRNLSLGWAAFMAVLNQQLPLISWVLQLIEIKCDQIVEEEPFHLTAKDIELRPKDVEGVAVTT